MNGRVPSVENPPDDEQDPRDTLQDRDHVVYRPPGRLGLRLRFRSVGVEMHQPSPLLERTMLVRAGVTGEISSEPSPPRSKAHDRDGQVRPSTTTDSRSPLKRLHGDHRRRL
jgi:hypothetical protein